MKNLAIAVIATLVSFGAAAQMKPAASASAPMAPMAPMASKTMPAASAPMKSEKPMKKHAAKKHMKAASAM